MSLPRMTQEDTFSGKCVGGPYDGQMRYHDTDVMRVYRPMMQVPVQWPTPQDTKVEVIVMGYYVYQFDRWIWRPA